MFFRWLGNVVIYSLGFFLVGFWITSLTNPPTELIYIASGIILFFSSYWVYKALHSELEIKYKKEVADIENSANKRVQSAEEIKEQAQKDESIWKKSLLERNLGFKTLTAYIGLYEKLRDETISQYLANKSHPAQKAADVVRQQAALRRQAELISRRTQAQIEMYENYAPFLADLKDEVPDFSENLFEEYTDEEKQDEVISFLTKEEYRKLSVSARNQLALDRFWTRPKSKWMIGKMYERYIGYLYEQKGFSVRYFGITERYEDLGRDLICQKGKEIHVVQCKNWSQFRTIYEKHIFQLFGTAFEFKEQHPNFNVHSVFYCTNKLSDVARRMASTLGLEVNEEFEFKKPYPIIKCNISTATQEKIYHLPFDQKYDDTKIDRNGEMYCTTVAEAEAAGFRRARKWYGTAAA